MKLRDWMPSIKAGKFTMFNNVRAKIDGYKMIVGLNRFIRLGLDKSQWKVESGK